MAHKDAKRLLGMNPQTAKYRLDRDLLFDLAVKAGYKCFRCSGELTRETFSVDHKQNWSVAADPKAVYFDLSNVAFSHHGCNSTYKSTPRPAHHYRDGCRCGACREWKRQQQPYDSARRRAIYQRTGW